MWSAMARPGTASNGTAAARRAGRVGPSWWRRPTRGKRLAVQPQSVARAMHARGPARYRAGGARPPTPREESPQKKAPALPHGQQAAAPPRPPAPVAVAIGRAAARAQRRGVPAALDARGSDGGSKPRHGGAGRPAITPGPRVQPTSAGGGRRRFCSHSQACGRPVGAPGFPRREGAPPRGLWSPRHPRLAKPIRSRATQAQPLTDAAQAVGASHARLCPNDDEARLGDRPLHKSLRVRCRKRRQDQHLWNTFKYSYCIPVSGKRVCRWRLHANRMCILHIATSEPQKFN